MAERKYISLNKLSTFLDNLKDTFATYIHSHTLSDITDYQIDDTLSSTSTNPVQNKVLDAEFEAISRAMTAFESELDKKVENEHSHDDKYYTETEIDTKLAEIDGKFNGKADATHNHDDSYYTKAEIDSSFETKADATHTHSEYVTDAECENLELISTEDIDIICGGTISYAEDVMF